MENDAAPAPGKFARDFDKAALTWDDNPHRRALTEAIAEGIRRRVPMDPSWQALEYGCGTGALSLLLAPHVREIVAADASPGMIEQLQRKLAPFACPSIQPVVLDLSTQAPMDRSFDLIAMAMVLHHIEDTENLFRRLAPMLRPGGWLVIADLCSEDGSFHAPDLVPHNGFVPAVLASQLRRSMGVLVSSCEVVHRVQKARGYEVFLLAACRT